MNPNPSILIIGGGFAGVALAQKLAKANFSDVTLIDKKDYFEVNFAAWRALSEPDLGRKSRMRYTDFVRSAFRHGEVTSLSATEAVLSDGEKISFDICVISSGSSYFDLDVVKPRDAPSIEIREAVVEDGRAALKAAQNILIIGGGAVGTELAGEIADHYPDKKVTMVTRDDKLVPIMLPKVSDLVEQQIRSLGIDIQFNKSLTAGDRELDDYDLVYHCYGLQPNTQMMKPILSETLDPQGYIKVDETLQVKGYPHMYALGDCANIEGEGKFAFTAQFHADRCAKNIIAGVRGERLKPYKLYEPRGLIPVGRKMGVAQFPAGIGSWRIVSTAGFLVNMKQKDMFVKATYGVLGAKRK